jgi:branched-subunit amino acid transport protein
VTLDRPDLLALFVLLGLITYGLRASFVMLQDRITLPAPVRRALTYVPAAVIAAIATPALLQPSGITLIGMDVRLLVAPVAVAVAWRSKNVVITIASGMTLLWLLTALAGR